MKSPSYLTWDNFQATIIRSGEARVHRVSASPRVEIFSDGLRNRIGLWLELPATAKIPDELLKLTFIQSEIRTQSGRRQLELAVATPSIYRQFYHFAVAVSERILVEQKTACDAVQLELRCFADLLNEKPLLSIERQLGLLGELLVIERLAITKGEAAFDAWIGPLGEPHDFRMGNVEIEVKTTLRPHRVHTIHGTEQLIPSKGCSLVLLSVLLGPAGGSEGFSLTDKVKALSSILAKTSERLKKFQESLKACGFVEADSRLYRRRLTLRRGMAISPVGKKFPAISRTAIQNALGPGAARIDALQYDLDVEGLEFEDGTAQFLRILPNAKQRGMRA